MIQRLDRIAAAVLFGAWLAGATWDAHATDQPTKPADLVLKRPDGVERIPLLPPGPGKTGDLILVWNNHDQVDAAHRGKRTPLTAAISHDEGLTWQSLKTLEDDPNGWYCYIAVAMAGDHVLLGHCSGSTKQVGYLSFTQITRFSLDWLYGR
jgi:hypothetical protein